MSIKFKAFGNQQSPMKEKRDCKECGVPLKDWQVKEGYDLCLDCYKESRKSSHEILKEKALEEESQEDAENEEEEDTETEEEVDEGVKEIDDEDLGYGSGHLEDDLQGEEEED